MPRQIQLRRGTGGAPSLAEGEPAFELDNNLLSVGNPANPPTANVVVGARLHSAAVAPTVNDDDTAGFAPLCRWMDTVAQKEYVCYDSTTGAAVWKEVGSGAGGTSPLIGKTLVPNTGNHHLQTSNFVKTANNTTAEVFTGGLDLAALTGVAIPTDATHVVFRAEILVNQATGPYGGTGLDLNIGLWVAGYPGGGFAGFNTDDNLACNVSFCDDDDVVTPTGPRKNNSGTLIFEIDPTDPSQVGYYLRMGANFNLTTTDLDVYFFLEGYLIDDTGTGGVNEFTQLIDTPSAYTGLGGYHVRVNAATDALEFVAAPTFLSLTDTPAAYAGQAGKSARVNATESGIEFAVVGGAEDPYTISLKSANYAVQTDDIRKIFRVASNSVIFTLPPTAITPMGTFYTFVKDNSTGRVIIQVPGSERISDSSSGGTIQNLTSENHASITLVHLTTGVWILLSAVGTWTTT